eukprot:scaffold312176_cov32-Tisochrysis_lutea.AAC.1
MIGSGLRGSRRSASVGASPFALPAREASSRVDVGSSKQRMGGRRREMGRRERESGAGDSLIRRAASSRDVIEGKEGKEGRVRESGGEADVHQSLAR